MLTNLRLIFIAIFLVVNNVAADENHAERKEFQELSSAMEKLSEIRKNWSNQFDTGISQLADACSYIYDEPNSESNDDSFKNYIETEKKKHANISTEFSTNLKSLQVSNKKIRAETCSGLFTIFGANSQKSKKCSKIDLYSDWNDELESRITNWKQDVDTLFISLEKLENLIGKQCLSLDFQNQFYSELSVFQTKLRDNEFEIFSNTIKFLQDIVIELE